MQRLEPLRRGARAVVFAVVTGGVFAGCAQQPAYQVYNQPVARSGTIESIRQVDKQRYVNGAGAVVGGLLGTGLGSLIGGGSGRTAATTVGAVGGAVVGNEMQRNQTELIWEIGVRYDDGSYGTIVQTQPPGLRIGDRVRVTDTGLELLPRGR
jgi:outer membrane lipoprotein SlyB